VASARHGQDAAAAALLAIVAFGLYSYRAGQPSQAANEILPPPSDKKPKFKILSLDGGPFRIYGGGEYLLRRDPKDLERYVAHGGVEVRPARRLVRLGSVAGVRFVAGGDVKASEEQDWKPAVSIRTGFEFDRPRDTDPPGRRWGLLFEAYTGPSPYGQFFRNQVRYFGAGIHFTL